jgi:TatD DNase family protein
MFTDTHTHLYDDRYASDRDEMIRRAIDAGVTRMYIPNCDRTTIEPMLQIEAAWPEYCFPMMGLHPCYVGENYQEELKVVGDWLAQRRFAAVGEIGLDYYWDKTFVPQQQEAFRRQIEWALQYDLPIVIHSRESTRDCIDIVRDMQNGQLRGIFHCFSGTVEEAREVADLGLYLGIGGVVTYKKSLLREVVAEMPLESMVLETDAPYLSPVPHRGRRNESSYIPLIAAEIAAIRQCEIAEVAAVTTGNAARIFAY